MDADSNDGTATESLNGETKPDPAKLAQTAIIKQDVMLSATSTQSPLATVSSVFTMPTVSMPSISVANNTGIGGLHDQLFMSVPSVAETSSTQTVTDTKPESNGTISAISSQPQQLFGQPQVAPQFFIAGQPIQGQSGTTSIPVQQLLIPVSTGNGTQQFISIPVSLATGGNQQIQLLTTSNGQIIATNLTSLQGLTQPLNMTAASSGLLDQIKSISGCSQPCYLGSQKWIVGSGPATHKSITGTLHSQQAQNVSNTATSHHTSSQALTNQVSPLPQLLTSAQGQILAVGPQQVLTPVSVPHVNSSTSSSQQQPAVTASVQSTAHLTQTAAQSSATTLHQQITQPVHSSQSAIGTQSAAARVTSQPMSQTPTSDGLPPNVSQLLPNTVSNSTESTTVDGINLDEIKEFAKQFKIRRLSLGLTQTQVGQALSATEGPAYSQSAICRFEKLDITPKSAQKIKPVLERWMSEAEERYKNGVQNLTDFIGSEPSKKRKRRTSFTPQALEVLNIHFEKNTHPSGAEMTELSEKLNYDREVIRVWFCNKRQALKNTIKKLKHEVP